MLNVGSISLVKKCWEGDRNLIMTSCALQVIMTVFLFTVRRRYVTENKMRLTQSASTCVQAQLTMQMSQKYKPGLFRGADNFQFDQVWYSLDSDSFPD